MRENRQKLRKEKADKNQQMKNHNPNQQHNSKKAALGPNTAICTGRRPLRHSPSGHHVRSERPPNQMADLGLITTV